ncbi:MAG: hypothetical protein IJ439_04710 [Tyzzerella sp.]|nr:hypothetical protein [Tyzzerella sp.]
MNYQEFVTMMSEKTNKLLESEVNVHIHKALKINGKERTGLTISEPNTNISPTIYLEEFFTQYQNGRLIDDIAQCIVSLYREVKFEHSWDVGQIQDFQRAKSKLAYRLIHFEKNEVLLEELPYVAYMDFAIIFYLLVESTEKGAATILITNDMLKCWGISVEQVYLAAKENTPRLLNADFQTMRTVICQLLGKNCQEVCQEEECQEESYMYVLSNQYRHFGAICMLYDRVLEDIANQIDEDFYILPSSIHEVIILPVSCSPSLAEINDMIVEINETQVTEEEVLSDHAYFYSKNERRLLSV